jgi:hypothetical protein
MLAYRNLKKGNISATELICITDALLVKVENVGNFYGTKTKCITEWIHPLNDLKLMSWETLSKNHTWEDVHM